MKPISLKFKCFGPFMEEQFIDFDDLRNFGLFLITGNTGAGKTTILDAMCMALYGQSSGGKRGELADMRCKLAGADDTTYVEYIFEVDGVRYKFYREAKIARKNLNEVHNCMRLEDGEYIPLMANPKKTTVNQMAATILQLTADQFRQIIILPQGQFEKLLVSSSAEKEAILTQVFHAERWGKIVEILKRKVKEETDGLKELYEAIRVSLENESVESLEQLNEKMTMLEEELKDLNDSLEKAKESKKNANEQYDKASEGNKLFEDVEESEKKYKELNDRASDMKNEKAAVDKAQKADSIRELFTSKKNAEKKVKIATEKYDESQEKLKQANVAQEEIEKQFEAHKAKAAAIEESKRKKTLMVEARGTYETLAEKYEAYEKAKKEEKAIDKKVAKAKKGFEQAEEKHKEACNLRDDCMTKLQEATRIYNSGAAARLGKVLLEKGGPCPVCGSTHHPQIAQPLEGDREVTDADLSKLNKEIGEATNKVKNAETERDTQKKNLDGISKEYESAKTSLVNCQAEYENAKKNLIEGIDSLTQLETTIAKIDKEINTYEKDSVTLGEKNRDALAAVSSAKAMVSATEEELNKADTEKSEMLSEWKDALAKEGFATEEEFIDYLWDKAELKERNEAVTRYDESLVNAKKDFSEKLKKVEGKVKPDMVTMKTEKDNADKKVDDLSIQLGEKENERKKLKGVFEKVSKDSGKYEAKADRVHKDEEFLNKLIPKSGVSFQRYVLGVMFTSVIDAANSLLEKVQGGRYKLSRTDDTSKGTNQGGLELAVFDANNGQARGVASLSGGEKFLVALSLAIGLSTVIQAQSRGIKMETMFIDEGFGSLDEKSIGEAVEVLSTVQAGNGLVGVISHVEKLRGILPYCIEVFHGENGNYMRS